MFVVCLFVCLFVCLSAVCVFFSLSTQWPLSIICKGTEKKTQAQETKSSGQVVMYQKLKKMTTNEKYAFSTQK